MLWKIPMVTMAYDLTWCVGFASFATPHKSNARGVWRGYPGVLGGAEERAIEHSVWQKQNGAFQRLRVLRTPTRRRDAVHTRLTPIRPTGEAQHFHFPPRAPPQQSRRLTRDHLGPAVIVLVKK